ncbi:bifunctional DNA-formamidopyrimidine glycosylase/DNA-(apurinic or apyrimidinic site) lyase [Agitococcus lubricus]|uniref:Formamidopyrimidine-DNA glycosylase n=1 Tax=Agitococcus lubricus TaxID=1077255 RepID=A0A2T5J003_9GAMM|nr:bifunctional DNA-formamidopyrimidine glycosylase/DNA-(apurinic or apyrimidinic site) lyase [Agitococcus lubricus]PTQ89625.1 DNA-(apurinic or apyrimidinic site) lyase [Agitococcus lubricus]
MPELPEVETTRRGLMPIIGQSVMAVRIYQPRLRQEIPTTLQDIVGQTILDLRRRGKYLLLDTANGSALIHLGMSGSLRLCDPNQALRKHDHVVLEFNNNLSLRFHDPRRFGVFLWLTEAPEQHSLLAHLGPEPLSDQFNAEYLFERSRRKNQPVKSFIMDGQVVVGVGNIYANEALFYAGIHPLYPAKMLTLPDFQRLYEHIYRILSAAIERGGTTLRDFVNSEGNPGYFQQELMVYGQEGAACKRCQHPLSLVRINNRSTVFCLLCQPAYLSPKG